MNLVVYSHMRNKGKTNIMKKTKLKKFEGYTEEQLAYFQAQQDMGEGIDLNPQSDYMDYLMGEIQGGVNPLSETQEYNEIDDPDYYID
jgi:hypothetical protein